MVFINLNEWNKRGSPNTGSVKTSQFYIPWKFGWFPIASQNGRNHERGNEVAYQSWSTCNYPPADQIPESGYYVRSRVAVSVNLWRKLWRLHSASDTFLAYNGIQRSFLLLHLEGLFGHKTSMTDRHAINLTVLRRSCWRQWDPWLTCLLHCCQQHEWYFTSTNQDLATNRMKINMSIRIRLKRLFQIQWLIDQSNLTLRYK